jgi:aryl-alcohol dehydrogenase-like predicted oxidoreductase
VHALREGGPLARVWAIGWVAGTGSDDLAPAVQALVADADARVRRAAVMAVGGGRLDDEDERVREAVIVALAKQGTPAARRALAGARYAEQTSTARAVLVEVAVRDGDETRLDEAAHDEYAGARVLAVRALSDAHDKCPPTRITATATATAAGTATGTEADPWVRAAVLKVDTAKQALVDDPDVEVRRTAAKILATHLPSMTAAERVQLGETAAASDDPWVRVRAVEITNDVPTLLRLSRDPSIAVRAAARDGLDAMQPDLHAVLAAQRDPAVRAAAYARLLCTTDDTSFPILAAALADPTEPPLVIEELRAIALMHPPERTATLGVPLPERAPRRPRVKRTKDRAEAPRRQLGRTGIAVSPLGISGAQELSLPSLAYAVQQGVNLFFWEPRYAALSQFLRGRRDLVVVAGSYHAAGAALERDVDSALRRLRRDTIDLFLIFWVRSPARLAGDAFDVMTRLRERGKIRAAGFSTHLRDLAACALAAHPWDVVMTRHSAAHPGAEARLFPTAAERGAGVLTFSALTYGTLLSGEGAPSAADCYRYSLSQPGVSACWSAPQWHDQLVENLEVLARPTLAIEDQQRLRAHGAGVHATGRRWDALVRRASGETREQGRELALALLDDAGREAQEVISGSGSGSGSRSRGH